MAISKVTLNGVTLMDVTSDTVEANTLLSGNTATKNDGTKVTGSYTPVTPTYQTKTITPTKSTQTVTPDSNYDALSQVTVNAIPSQYIIPSGTLEVTENGTVDVTQYASADIAVPSSEPVLQEKTVTPSTSTQVITADSGGEITYINEQNQQCQYVMASSRRQYISLTWIEDLVVGETYHFYIVFDRRSYGGAQYYFVYDGDAEFTGFPMSFNVTSTTSTRTDTVNLSATELYRTGVSDDDGTNYMTLVVTKQGQSYDGLSKVTVNPIEPVVIDLVEKTVTPSSQTQVVTGTAIEDFARVSLKAVTLQQNVSNSIKDYYAISGGKKEFTQEDLLSNYEIIINCEVYVLENSSYKKVETLEVDEISKLENKAVTSDYVEYFGFTQTDGTTTGTKYVNLYARAKSLSAETMIQCSSLIKLVDAHDGLSKVTVNPIPSEYVVPTGTLAITQNGTVNVKNYEYANVNVEGGGGGTADESLPVRFLDYDGTVVYSYTAEDFANLTAMPSNPSHTGLTAQGWNWSLADAKEQVAEIGACDIGQMYITDDGKTRIYVELNEYTLLPYLGLGVNGSVEIDWGDNSAHDTLSGTSLTSPKFQNHVYSSAGEYVIKLTPISGTFSIIGSSSASYLFRKSKFNTTNIHITYLSTIKKVELGSSVILQEYAYNCCYYLESISIPQNTSIGQYVFRNCYKLYAFVVPNGGTIGTQRFFDSCMSLRLVSLSMNVTIVDLYAFSGCYALKTIVIPKSVSSIGSYSFSYCYNLEKIYYSDNTGFVNTNTFMYCYQLNKVENISSVVGSMFQYCYSLMSVTISNTVTSIGNNAFNGCYSVSQLTIPSGVTSIENSAFGNCYGMKEYHFLPTTPPTLGTNAFGNIQSDCKIYVPAESLEAYKTATNWSTYANYMVGE